MGKGGFRVGKGGVIGVKRRLTGAKRGRVVVAKEGGLWVGKGGGLWVGTGEGYGWEKG